MAKTESTMLALGTEAPDFSLPNTDGKIINLSDFSDAKALLVMFICNHCPYVIHIRDQLAKLTTEYMKKNVAIVAINSNDVVAYPQDSMENMKKEKQLHGYQFDYLFDESQNVAKAYRAACTPDFFLFDANRHLAYRGQMDGARPGNSIVNDGVDLRTALECILIGARPSSNQKPSLGCNIKWKLGNEP
ncbi:MAG: thioredoxin family protein [Bdellovibrionota bacterium]